MSMDTVIKASTWRTPWGAHPSLELENGVLIVTILPQFGGKIVSIRRSADAAEFLLQAQQPYKTFGAKGDFAESDRGGFDECFPSVSPIYSGGQISIPDHGDLWRIPWTATPAGNSLLLKVNAFSMPVTFQRRITLKDETLFFDYELHNFGHKRLSFLYAAHPLLQIEDGDRIVLPCEVKRVVLEGWTLDDRPAHTFLNWPTTKLNVSEEMRDLSSVGPLDGKSAAKLFADPLETGRAGLYRSKLRAGVHFSFNVHQLPYLGLWISHGAWPRASTSTGHYAVAIEPTTAPHDSLEDANVAGLSTVLEPGSRMCWEFSLTVAEIGNMEEFRRIVEADTH